MWDNLMKKAPNQKKHITLKVELSTDTTPSPLSYTDPLLGITFPYHPYP